MSTEAQRKANRQNAKKSTSPRTPEGKARSSKNALKHGLLARDAVMADEDPADTTGNSKSSKKTSSPRMPSNSSSSSRSPTLVGACAVSPASRPASPPTSTTAPTVRPANATPTPSFPGRNGENQLLGKSMQDHTQALHNLARYRTMTSRDITRALRMIRQLRKDECDCKENRAANGAIHRPTLTDPDPYNTPDPMEPQPPRYEPPTAAAQTSNPIGFRAQSQSVQTEDGCPECRGTACRARQPGPVQNVAAQNVAARSADLGFEIRGLSSQSVPSPQATLGGESRFTNHASRMSGRPHRQTQGPVKTNALRHRRSPQDELRNEPHPGGARSEPPGNGGTGEVIAAQQRKKQRRHQRQHETLHPQCAQRPCAHQGCGADAHVCRIDTPVDAWSGGVAWLRPGYRRLPRPWAAPRGAAGRADAGVSSTQTSFPGVHKTSFPPSVPGDGGGEGRLGFGLAVEAPPREPRRATKVGASTA